MALGGAAAPAAPAANTQTYTDSTGENPAAPDITTIVVSNNDAGVVSFRINVPNRPTFTQDILVWLFVDIGWLNLKDVGVMSWVVLVIVSLLLAVGMSWSHIRRRLTGQVDTDDVEDGRG